MSRWLKTVWFLIAGALTLAGALNLFVWSGTSALDPAAELARRTRRAFAPVLFAADGGPTAAPTASTTATLEPTPTATATVIPSETPTLTPKPTRTPRATPTPTVKPTVTPTTLPGGTRYELLVFDWNKAVVIGDSGFAEDKPVKPEANGDMTRFVGGTLYFRARVRSIPVNQPGMKLGWCFWQKEPVYAEECSPNQPVPGVPGTDLQWQVKLNDLNHINNSPPIQWDKPRWKHGFVVRNSRGKPVSNKLDFNWSGENPNHWYPLDIHYTVVVVEPGRSFSGWKNYGW